MPGYGVGGLFANLFNPGLDDRLAQHITPNPNPLAQQGQPVQPGAVDQLGNPVPSPGPQGPNLAPPAVTAPDPANAANVAALTQPSNAYAADLLRAHRLDQESANLNHSIQGMSASFGTAAQQQAKQQALAAGGGTVGDSLAALHSIQGMQDQTIEDNQKARFMGNAGVFAQTLRANGMNVSDAQATEIMNNPDALAAVNRAMGSNATQTEQVKNWNTARAAMKAAGKTDAEINAAMPPEMLVMGSGTNLSETQYLQEKALATSQGKGADFPTFDVWQQQHKQAATETEDAHKIALQLPSLQSQLTSMQQTADSINPDAIKGIFGNVSKQYAAQQIFNYDPSKGGIDPATLYGDGKTLSAEETNAVIAARKLHLANYAANFKDAGSGQRLSQGEATRLGAASDTLGTFSGSVDDYMGRVNDVKNKIGHSMSNAHGEARDLDNLPIQYRSKIDPSFIEGPNALKNLPQWAQPVAINSADDIAKLPYGQAYKPGPGFGKYSGRILFKGQEDGFED